MRDGHRENAETLAKASGLEIEFIRKKNFRAKTRAQEILKVRGEQPGLVHIFSAMEICTSQCPWHDKKTNKTFLKMVSGKCLHTNFYFMDEVLPSVLFAHVQPDVHFDTSFIVMDTPGWQAN